MPAALALAALRRRPGGEGRLAAASRLLEVEKAEGERLPFGVDGMDAAFGGEGLPLSGAHEIAAVEEADAAAASGFALCLLARLQARRREGTVLVVQEAHGGREAGLFYAPGLHALSVDPDRLLFVSVRHPAEALRVVDEAVRSGAPAAVIAELWSGEADLKATRRFNVAAERTGVPAFLLARRPAATSAALTRWRVRSGLGPAPAPGLLGPPTFTIDLARNRFGPLGSWTVEWDPHDRLFRPTRAVAVAGPAADRSADAPPDEADRRRRQAG